MNWGAGVAMSFGIGHQQDLDPVLLWLRSKPAAIAQILPLAWKPAYAMDAALKSKKKTKQNKTKNKKNKVGPCYYLFYIR